MRRSLVLGLLAALLAGSGAQAQPPGPLPDVTVLDQDGRRLDFDRDLLAGRTVAIDFVYTSCTSFCLSLSANFRVVQDQLAARMGKDLALVSVTVDPATDTPERLKEFALRFGPAPGWTFVTGAPPDIARLLGRLGVPPGDPGDHTALVLVHNDATGGWTHVDGNDPFAVAEALVAAAGPAPHAAVPRAVEAARRYMTNPVLRTQDDRPVHFFDDLMPGRTVAINFFYSGCKDACPLILQNLARVQDLLGNRLGRSINLISLSVDPEHDRPIALKEFAGAFGARPGWYFLTGEPDEMMPLLHRLGAYTADPLDHNTALIVGNVDAGVWSKLPATGDPAGIARAVLTLAASPAR